MSVTGKLTTGELGAGAGPTGTLSLVVVLVALTTGAGELGAGAGELTAGAGESSASTSRSVRYAVCPSALDRGPTGTLDVV